MDQRTIILVAALAVAVLLLALLFLLRGRRQHVRFDADHAAPRPATPPPATPDPSLRAAAPDPTLPPEGRGVADEATAAIEDVVDQFIGLDAHPSGQAAPAGDRLTLLKGLGPRAAARLGELGVTSFAQMAAWDASDVAAIDAQMGAFQGRIGRDRWVDQARLLAKGDRDGFEAAFGKLGSN